EGRIVKRGLRRRSYRLPRALLGSGVRHAQAMATDAFGHQVLTPAVKLRVDGQPPRVAVEVSRARGQATVRLRDADSGLDARSTLVDFGDGSRDRGGSKFHHDYGRPGRYPIVVRARDRVGNRLTRRFEAVVG